MSGRLPAIVLGGWLGAGKTTLVNHLLRHAGGRRIAVLVNDFGEISIDADLIIGARDGDVIPLAGGCLCCSAGADLVGMLTRIAGRDPAPDLVLIECSGVALPRSVMRTAGLVAGIRTEGIVTIVDAEQIVERAGADYIADTVRAQLTDADLLVLNKIDLVDPTAAGRLLADLAPRTPVIQARHGQVAAALILGVQPAAAGKPAFSPGVHLPAMRIVAETHRFDAPIDVEALVAGLSGKDSNLLRAKGWLTGLDGRHWLLHAVGRRVTLSPLDASPVLQGQLVLIRGPGPTAPLN